MNKKYQPERKSTKLDKHTCSVELKLHNLIIRLIVTEGNNHLRNLQNSVAHLHQSEQQGKLGLAWTSGHLGVYHGLSKTITEAFYEPMQTVYSTFQANADNTQETELGDLTLLTSVHDCEVAP